MAIFPDISTIYQGKTQTNLVISDGLVPAERFIASKTEAVKFQYAFGPEGNQNVVIPKGKIVTAAGLEYDIETETYAPAVKICGDGAEGDIPLGVSLYNAYEKKLDKTSANNVTLLANQYIRVPLFGHTDAATAKAFAKAIQFGAAWVDTDALSELMGSYVVSDSEGNFRPYDSDTDDFSAVVGQVLAVEKATSPVGYLQYFMEMTDNEFTKLIQGTATNYPSPGRKEGSGLSIDTFPIGSYIKDKASLAKILKDFQAGIPFLTDGYFKARVTKCYAPTTDATVAATVSTAANTAYTDTKTYGKVKNVRVMGTASIDENGLLSVESEVGSAIFIQLPEKLATTKIADTDAVANHPELAGVEDTIVVKINSVTVPSNRIHVDYDNNIIGVYFDAPIEDKLFTIEATVLENQMPGIPTGWDYKGNIGEARILLKK